jgi:hypothetical protein
MSNKTKVVCDNCGKESGDRLNWYTICGVTKCTKFSNDRSLDSIFKSIIDEVPHDFCSVECMLEYIESKCID